MNNRLFKQLFSICLRISLTVFLCVNVVHANQLVINGVEEELAENVRLVAGDIPEDVGLIDVYIELLPEQTRKALAAFGYFEPEIEVKRTIVDEENVISVNVNLGSPVRISSINVKVMGAASNDIAFKDIQKRIPLTQNAIFLSADYEATKGLLLDAALAKGYFDFKFTTNAVLVSRTNRTAIINLVANSGPRFTFGAVKFNQAIFSDEFLSRWLTFKPDDPYDVRKIAELTQNLQNSGYFSTVRVTPQRDIRYGPTVPVLVSLKSKNDNQVGLGIGYSTDELWRGKVSWSKPLINRSGHSGEAEFKLSAFTQAVSFSYRIPRKNQPLYNYWGVQYGVKNTIIEDSKSLLSTLNFERVRRFANQWNESIFIRWERNRDTKFLVTDTTDLVLPGVRYSRTRRKGAPFLNWGQSTSFQILYGNRNLLSTIDFYKASFNYKYLRAVTPRNKLIFSFQYGAITTNDFEKVPLSQLFFAGGDQSIRGYRYRSVSPLDANGNPRGGRYLEAGSAEYNFRYADRWSLAVFADVGRAFNNFSTAQKIGGGIGLRWQSPVGPFRIDVARPIGDEDNDDFRVHLSLGPDI